MVVMKSVVFLLPPSFCRTSGRARSTVFYCKSRYHHLLRTNDLRDGDTQNRVIYCVFGCRHLFAKNRTTMVIPKTCVFGYHHLFARNRIPGTGTGASPSSPRTLGRGDGLPGSHIWTCPKLTYVFSTTRLSSEGESSDVRRFSAVRGCGGLWYSRKPQHGVVRRMLTSSIACRPHWAMTRLTAWKH